MKPKLIIFDCWDTIIKYIDIEKNYGWKLVFAKLENPDHVSPETFLSLVDELLNSYFSQNQYEVTFISLLSYAMEDLNLTYHGKLEELELAFIQNYSPVKMDGIDDLLSYCDKSGIRTAVISNTIMSEENTKNFINELIPNHNFEFIIASSRIAVKKPNPRIFLMGCHKSKVLPEETLYVGDSFTADVVGPFLAGLTPVWFNWKKYCTRKNYDFPYLHISAYSELIEYLESK